jgi:N-acetylglucosamine kinase-like BadF-type ATPase
MSHVFVGVDGGGTRTRAVAVDERGNVVDNPLHRALGSSSLIDPMRPARSADAVERTVRTLAESLGLERPCEAMWVGLAGAGHEASRAAVEIDLASRGLAQVVEVGTDVEAALADAFPERPGILLVSGTGSVAAARGDDGEVRRVGGWGSLLGDEGSGYAVGLAGLRAAIRMIDGRERATELLPGLLEWAGVDAADELPAWVAGATKAEVAALAAGVVAAADTGDPSAGHILADAVEALVDHVCALASGPDGANRRDPDRRSVDVALAGGMIGSDGGGLLRPRVVSALEEHGFRVLPDPVDAARGAARHALRRWEARSGA